MPINNNYRKKLQNQKSYYELLDFLQNLNLHRGQKYFFIEILYFGVKMGFFTCDEEGMKCLIVELKRLGLHKVKITIYQSLQMVKESVVDEKYVNRLFSKGEEGFQTLSDDKIEKYCFIFIDCDPVHEADTQVPDSELKYAVEVRDEIVAYLEELGFTDLIVAFSGNGQHIYVPIDVPADYEHKMIIKKFLSILNDKFSTEKVKIDVSVHNPARITKFYGSWSTKGTESKDIPYRKCEIISKGENNCE